MRKKSTIFLRSYIQLIGSTYNQGDKIKHFCVFQWYYCNNFYARKHRFEQHTETYSGIPGVVYGFNNKNLISFEDNIVCKGDLTPDAYMDFETTSPTNLGCSPEQKNMLIVSYVIVFAFHRKLNFNHVIVQRSFMHSFKKLTTIDHLTSDQMECIYVKLVNQLKDYTICVSQKSCKNSVSQMFCVELKFVADRLLRWFNRKCESQKQILAEKQCMR